MIRLRLPGHRNSDLRVVNSGRTYAERLRASLAFWRAYAIVLSGVALGEVASHFVV